jgi:hypothetical protein
MRAEQALLAQPDADPGALAREAGVPRHVVYAARARLRQAGAPGF